MNLRQLRSIAAWHLGTARWVFIHIPKNAGVSVRKHPELEWRMIPADPYFHISRDYTRRLAAFMAERGEHHGFQHARWRDLHPKVRNRLRAVAVVRNPWARVVSRFRFAMTARNFGKTPEDYAPRDFEAFLEERHVYGGREFYWHRAIRGWYPQTDYVTDEEGRLRADCLRLEHLSEEAVRYFGLSKPPARRNRSRGEGADWISFYTPRTIQIVADWYARDIETFGFDFDTAATRNVWATRPEPSED
ncbi:MAG: hypothetical protein D6811_10620 [Alphaproteobacteria bacterium]|nr:MAG: hypothetical protein D6811_10620 [Alphaproteobacteria bacterium]